MFCGGGETVVWYQKSERMCDLSIRTLPRRVSLRSVSDAALFFAFWSRAFHRSVEFSGVIGRRTPSVARGREAAGGYGGKEYVDVGERGKKEVLFQLILPLAARKCLSIHNWRVDQSWIPVPPIYVSSAYARTVKLLWLMVMPFMFDRSALKRGSSDMLKRRGARGSP